MNEYNFVAIDFETANDDNMPCQLGIVIVEHGEIVQDGIFLIKPPGNRYDNNKVRVHGIYPEDTVNSPEFDEVWEFLAPYLKNQIIVAHYIENELNIINKALSYYKMPAFKIFATACTKKIYCNHSLGDVCKALGITLDAHHDALCDARACAEIYLKYLNGVDPYTLNYPERKKKNPFDLYEKGRIKPETKKQDLTIVENRDTIFYDKKIVLSGVFEKFPERDDLGVLLKKYGADLNSSISSKTQLFITGGKGVGPLKMKKVLDLINSGINIQIIEEKQLYDILSSI